MKLQLLTAATATNGKPSAATDGFAFNPGASGLVVGDGIRWSETDSEGVAVLMVASTAGSGTMTADLRLWVYSALTAMWMPFGPTTAGGTDTDKGKVNNGVQLAESNTDKVSHTQVYYGLRHYDRVYLEISGIGGTLTAISAWLVVKN